METQPKTGPARLGTLKASSALHWKRAISLSAKERARQILDIQGLGDSKPSQLMEKRLNLLGGEDPRVLFMETFLRHLPSRVQTALANTSITEPRALAEEADRFFLATQQSGAEALAVTLSAPSTVKKAWERLDATVPSRRWDTGECLY